MRFQYIRYCLAAVSGLLLIGCTTAYQWGATEDREWGARIGTVNYTQVAQELGQPIEKLPLPSGDLKVRWYARPITTSNTQGTMEDYSVEHTEVRAYWRDMRFNKDGVLTRAWLSDQRELANSEAP
jgi:hypothetical protein